MLDTYNASNYSLATLSYQNKVGNPTIFDCKYVDELKQLKGDYGGRKVLNKYLHFEIGKSLTIAGFVTAATSILVYDRKTLVVSLLGTYLYGIVLDNFIDGFSIRKRVCILSKKYPEIQQFVVHELHRGATLYPAVGGLGNQEQTEVVTILEKSEYAKLLAFIHETDQSAFVTVSTVSEVIGEWNKHKKNRLRKAE